MMICIPMYVMSQRESPTTSSMSNCSAGFTG